MTGNQRSRGSISRTELARLVIGGDAAATSCLGIAVEIQTVCLATSGLAAASPGLSSFEEIESGPVIG